MRMQLDRNLEELNEYRRKLDLSSRDNKRLQDDLLTVTRENQVRIRNFQRIQKLIVFFSSRQFIKNLNMPLMTKKISNYKFKNTSKK